MSKEYFPEYPPFVLATPTQVQDDHLGRVRKEFLDVSVKVKKLMSEKGVAPIHKYYKQFLTNEDEYMAIATDDINKRLVDYKKIWESEHTKWQTKKNYWEEYKARAVEFVNSTSRVELDKWLAQTGDPYLSFMIVVEREESKQKSEELTKRYADFREEITIFYKTCTMAKEIEWFNHAKGYITLNTIGTLSDESKEEFIVLWKEWKEANGVELKVNK